MTCIDKVFARLWIYTCCYKVPSKVPSKSNDKESIDDNNIIKNIHYYGHMQHDMLANVRKKVYEFRSFYILLLHNN